MQLVPVPKDQYGNFFEGDSYIVYAASEYGKPVAADSKVSFDTMQLTYFCFKMWMVG
jgi:hypothetical protein